MRSLFSLLPLLTTLFFTSPLSHATIYKWHDKSGQPHVANSLAAVPTAYRSTVEKTEVSSPKNEGTNNKKAIAPTHLTDSNFTEEVINSDVPVLVDFWAAWCVPCRMIAPTIMELSAEYSGRVKIAKYDVEETIKMSDKYKIRSLPTLILFKDGKEMKRISGAYSKEALKEFITLVE